MRQVGLIAGIVLLLATCRVFAGEFKTLREALEASSARMAAKDYEGVQKAGLEALALAANDLDRKQAHQQLARAYEKLGNVDGYATTFDFLVLFPSFKQPDRVRTTVEFLTLASKQGALESVVEKYQRRLKEMPDDFPALAVLGVNLHGRESTPEEIQLVKRFREANRSLSVKRVKEWAPQLLKSTSDPAGAHAQLALDWAEAEQPQEVQFSIDSSLAAKEPSTPQARSRQHYLLGEAYRAIGRFDDAVKQYEESINTEIMGRGQIETIRGKIELAKKKVRWTSP